LSPRHGIGPRSFQYTYGVGTRVFGLAVFGRIVRHDVLVVFHERQKSRHQSHPELGEQSVENALGVEFHGKRLLLIVGHCRECLRHTRVVHAVLRFIDRLEGRRRFVRIDEIPGRSSQVSNLRRPGCLGVQPKRGYVYIP